MLPDDCMLCQVQGPPFLELDLHHSRPPRARSNYDVREGFNEVDT